MKGRRVGVVAGILALVAVWLVANPDSYDAVPADAESSVVAPEGAVLATEVLGKIPVKGRAPKTGYNRDEFYTTWPDIDGCDARNVILARDLTEVVLEDENGKSCIVLSGVLQDPYTGERIDFVRGTTTSSAVQIDHVVALSDAWQKGAQALDKSERKALASDPLNLLAVDGPANQQKGDSDTASWLPPNKSFRCTYVARQISVKYKYNLWVTEAEGNMMKQVLESCPEEVAIGVELD